MKKYLFLFLGFPVAAFSQSAIIKPTHIAFSKDTLKSISYPLIIVKDGAAITQRINSIIKASVFNKDTAKPLNRLLKELYKKNKSVKMEYSVNHNKSGLLSITIYTIPSGSDRKPPIYLNFDLNTGNLITLNNMFKTKNDSFSIAQAVIPTVIDSIQLFEQTLDKNNVNYGKIIEWLNTSLSNFRDSYHSDYSMSDKEIIVNFNCFIPHNLLSYNHTYRIAFLYRILKNTFKPEIIKRLIN